MAEIHSLPLGRRKLMRRALKDDPLPRQWVCNICKAEIGVATSEILQLTLSPMLKGKRIVGGNRQKVCGCCYRRGRMTPVP